MMDSIPNKILSPLLRVLEGSASPADQDAVRRWRDRSVDNDLCFREMEAIWTASTGALTSDALPVDPDASRPTADEILDRGRPRKAPPVPQRGGAWRARRRQIGVAGGFAAAILAALLLLQPRPDAAEIPREYVSGPDELITATLADGTVVRLAPNSRLRVAPGDGSRDVWLTGRAFFSVPEREGERFVVRTRLGDVTVLGTRFGVHARTNELETAVLQGAVQMTSAAGSARIASGHIGRLQEGVAPQVEAAPDLPARFTWMGSFLVFKNTPLHQVADEVYALYGVRVVISDSALQHRVVTGRFSQENAADVMEVVCRVVDAVCSFTHGVVEMSPRNRWQR
jgi:transmembrane sensor